MSIKYTDKGTELTSSIAIPIEKQTLLVTDNEVTKSPPPKESIFKSWVAFSIYTAFAFSTASLFIG
jgi:hypothetical protein